MTVTDEMVEKAARGLCRKRILDNLRFDGEMQDAEFQQRAEDASWTDFVDQARAALTAALASPEGVETAKRELRIKELEGEISFVKECNRMVKAANDEAHRENEKLAAQVSQYAGKMLANQYDYTSVRRAGAEAMRERAAKWHDDAAEILDRDADAAASAGCYCADSGGDLRHYASLHRGHATAIRALEIEG